MMMSIISIPWGIWRRNWFPHWLTLMAMRFTQTLPSKE